MLSGPDFFNARLAIGHQEWAGNVEIHIKSSDWYAHHHEQDPAYDNVILHVVWEYDLPVYRKDKTTIPTLVLGDYVSKELLMKHQQLFEQKGKWIACETELSTVLSIIINGWLDSVYIARLEQKVKRIEAILKQSQNNWESVLFIMLTRNFGTKINAEAFQSLAQHIPFNLIQKCAPDIFRLEALLMGMGSLIPEHSTDSYALQLTSEYDFLKHKFQLDETGVLPIQFYKLRPSNFPTIRLSQLADLYHMHTNLFQKILETSTLEDYYVLLSGQASAYWDTHYSFDQSQSKRIKKISKNHIDLLLINTIIPIRFAYARYKSIDEESLLLEIMRSIAPEKNTIIKKFQALGSKAENALDSQALLQLKTEYCDKKQCLQCRIGNWLLGQD